MDPFAETSSKSVLEIAGELGVRSNSVLKALKDLGVSADDPSTPVDPDLEDVLVDHLINQGAVPSKFKRPKQVTGEPFMSDALLFEAMGAGEDGFSETRIPRQLRVESGFAEEPSWFNRLFGQKRETDVVRSLRESPKTDEELNSLFGSSKLPSGRRSPSPLAAPNDEQDFLEETPEPTIELSEDILETFDDLDMEGIEDIADIELEGLDELSQEAEQQKQEEEEQPEEEPEEQPKEESEEPEETEEEVSEEETGEETEEDEEDEEIPMGMFERFLSRIHLTPTEMWTVTGGSLAIMLTLLGITIYWFWYKSDRADMSLWEQATTAYFEALNAVNEETGQPLSPAEQAATYGEAAELFSTYLKRFPEPENLQNTTNGLRYLCNSHFQKAQLHQQLEETDPMTEEYQEAVYYYEQFLEYLEEKANKTSEILSILPDTEEARAERRRYLSETFPDQELQEEALFNRGYAYWQLDEYNSAVQAYREYLNKFSGHQNAPQVRLNIGRIYEEWAVANKENELELLEQADLAYNEAIEALPDDAHIEKMKLYEGLGRIKNAIFERHRKDNQKEAMENPLMEAIAYLENAEEEARQAGDALSIDDKIRVFKSLGDLYLTRGEIAEEELRDLERVQQDFRQGDYKNTLDEGVKEKKETTDQFIINALALYNELLDKRDIIPNEIDAFELMYNKASGLRLLGEYEDALATAQELDQEIQNALNDNT